MSMKKNLVKSMALYGEMLNVIGFYVWRSPRQDSS